MYEFVRKDQCTGITDGGKDPGVGVLSAIEQKGTFCSEHSGQLLFQFLIGSEVACQQAGGRGSGQKGFRSDGL